MLKPLLRGKTSWTITLYKIEGSPFWYLDIPYLLTFREILCGGTEESLDYWYEKLTGESATTSSRLTCTVSSEPISDVTTTLHIIEELSDFDDSGTYLDLISGISCWLCPYLKWLFGHKPDTLWLSLEPK
jgi:hypothetical protein